MSKKHRKFLGSLKLIKHQKKDFNPFKKWGQLCSCLLIIGIILNCGGKDKPVEKKLDFKIEKTLVSDDIDSPYFFANILDVCSNSRYIYVSDWKRYCINIYDHQFDFIKKIGKKGNGPSEFGQILVDMACNDQKLYVITINRLYVFSAGGNFEKEIVLRFLPGRIFPIPSGFAFKKNSSDYVFTITDLNGKAIETFYPNKFIVTKECGRIFAEPEAFMSAKGDLIVFDSTHYNIELADLSTKETKTLITRDVDFLGLYCRINRRGKKEISGGYSWMIESRDSFYYFYFDSKKQLQIDVFNKLRKGRLELKMTGKYTGGFHPLCVLPNHEDTFIGVIAGDYHILRICKLVEFFATDKHGGTRIK